MISVNSISLGQPIVYKGDMANHPGQGAVVAVVAKQRSGSMYSINFGSASLDPIDDSKVFDIALDDGRLFRQVYVSNIGGDFGNKSCRFMLGEGAPLDLAGVANLLAGVAIRNADLKAKADEAAAIFAAAMAEAKAAGLKLGLIPEADFQAAKKRGSAAAYNLRQELKAAGIKASVKQDGYNSINVWVDPADKAAAAKIADKYQAGNFDGMDDCYKYDPSSWGKVFGDVRYVFCYGSAK